MGNINTLRFNPDNNKGLQGSGLSNVKKNVTKAESESMKKSSKEWESRSKSKKKRKKTLHFHERNGRQRPKSQSLRSHSRSDLDKYKLLKKHMREMAIKQVESECDGRQKQIYKNDIRMRTRRQHQLQKDTHDQLLRTFNVAARDSPSKKCNRWVESMPHPSVWDKGHTLSGQDLTTAPSKERIKTKPRKHKRRQSQHKVDRKTSQRSLLMKKIIAKKLQLHPRVSAGRLNAQESNTDCSYDEEMSLYEDSKSSDATSLSRSAKKLQIYPKPDAGGRNVQGSNTDCSYDEEMCLYGDSESSDETSPSRSAKKLQMYPKPDAGGRNVQESNTECGDDEEMCLYGDSESSDTTSLSRSAKKLQIYPKPDAGGRNVQESNTECSDDETYTYEESKSSNETPTRDRRKHSSKQRSKMPLPSMANNNNNDCETSNDVITDDTMTLQLKANEIVRRVWSRADKIEKRRKQKNNAGLIRMKTARERKRRKRQERRQEKMRGWLRRKLRNRPYCRYKKNIYARKHRPGLFITQEKGTSSLGWAILQSIKTLEKKGIAYPFAILKNVKRKWGYKNLTLVQVQYALESMEKSGVLKSDIVRQRDNCWTPKRYKRDNRLPRRASFIMNEKEFALDESDTSLDYGVEAGQKKRGPVRIRFRHKTKDFTSVKSGKYGDHELLGSE